MEFFAISHHVFSFVSQKSKQNHQMKMLTKAGNTAVALSVIGGATYLLSKVIEKKNSELSYGNTD